MLRLASSHIGLSSKDLAWHKDRHHARQALRNSGLPVEVIGSPVRSCPETPDYLKLELPYYFPHPPASERGVRHGDEDEGDDLFFNEPVPQGSRTFWDRIMADAGTPLGIQVQHVDRRPRIIEESKASQGIIRSSKGSIKHVLNDSMGTTEAHDYAGSSPYPYESPNDPGYSSQSQSPEQALGPHTSSVFVLPSSHRQDLVGVQGEHRGRTVHHFSGSMELDGSSDLRRYHRESQEQGASKQPPDTQQGQYKARDDSAERAVSNSPFWQPKFEVDSSALTSSPPQDPCKVAISPQLPVCRVMEAMRRRSSGLQRSPLCISHAVASSSPERQSQASTDPSTKVMAPPAGFSEQDLPLEVNGSGDGVSEVSGMFSQPPRRRIKYRVVSQSNSLDSQEVSLKPGSPQGAASTSKPVAQGRSAISLALSTAPSISPASDTPPPPPQPLTPSPSSAPHRKLNPSAMPFTPDNTPPMPAPRRLFPSCTLSVPPPASLPLRPFSATPRSVSFSGSLASPSPPARPPACSLPRPSMTPPSPPLTVYNDRLPAIHQPQTPAQLSRHGFNNMSSLHASAARITQTAPVHYERASWAWRAFAAQTPTRVSRHDRLEDQENVGVDVEADRLMRRERAARRGRRGVQGEAGHGGGHVVGGGHAVAVGSGDGLLATTPE